MKRRDFLLKSGVLTAGSLLIPSFLRANLFSSQLRLNKKRLVVIQLSGGNDGLNTIVPYGMDTYFQMRKQVALDANGLLKLDDTFGFHPALKGVSNLYEKGWLSIINSVGYPNPNRSHFRSMDIWHTASDSNQNLTDGWIGRLMDSQCEKPFEAIEIGGQLSLALKGKQKAGIVLTDPKIFYDTIHAPFFNELGDPISDNGELNYLYKMFNDTKLSAEYIYDQYKLVNNQKEYGRGRLGQQLKQIATLIKSDIQTPIFYTSLGGFDTHVNQGPQQIRLLTELDEGVAAFVEDLEEDDLMKDTTVLIFSEFGRRLEENASRGTDHGSANVLLVIDKNLSTSAYGYNSIDLVDLHQGDPKFKIDFRSVYQELLVGTLGVASKTVLGREFDSLDLFK